MFEALKGRKYRKLYKQALADIRHEREIKQIWETGFNRLREDKSALIAENKLDREDHEAACISRDTFANAFEVALSWLAKATLRSASARQDLAECQEDFHESVEDMDNLISTLNSGGVSVSWEQGQDGAIIPHLDFTDHDRIFAPVYRPSLPVERTTTLFEVGSCYICGLPKSECLGYQQGLGFRPIVARGSNPEADAHAITEARELSTKFNDGDQSGTAA